MAPAQISRAIVSADPAEAALVRRFVAAVNQTLDLDWMLPAAQFDRAVEDGLRQHYPELSGDARRALAGNFSYSHR